MLSGQIILQILVFGFVLWFSLYLLNHSTERKMLYTGLGLGAYALTLAFDLLAQIAPSTNLFLRLHWAFLIFPAIFWTGATLQLFPEENPSQSLFANIWQWAVIPISIVLFALFLLPGFFWQKNQTALSLLAYTIFIGVGVLPLVTGLWLIWIQTQRKHQTRREKRRSTGLIITAALFFALGSGAILLQFNWLPHTWAILAIGIDLEVLGLAIAYLDAFEQGETFWPDFLRSFAISALVALLFGGQVAFAMAISTGVTLPMTILLLTTISLAIFIQVFSDPIQTALDRLVFAQLPRLRQERAELRGVTAALPRTITNTSPLTLDETEFTRITRRALSHFGDLPKLASNPLTQLPLVETRLLARQAPLNTLERAAELKTILSESIERLKPPTEYTYGISDEWRYYNALYYPYVLGLRPYSRRATHIGLDEPIRQTLSWFRTTVPERTLHNWQNAAATLVAKDLREQSSSENLIE